MQSITRNPLPRAVFMVGDRIGLNFDIKKKEATEVYIEQNQRARLELSQLKHSYYKLDETKTTTKNANLADKKSAGPVSSAKNPLKLNARLRGKLYKLSREEKRRLQYQDFVKINQLWEQYALKVLETNQQANIFHMDLHGCKLTCTASKNPTLVGVVGMVVQETKHTFIVIRSTNRVVVLPKRESIFEFNIADKKRYRIHGCNLLFTVQARTKVKYKHRREISEV